MKILLTNDDGIRAKGLKHLWKALSNHAEVTIVAPSWEKSGSGLSTTLTKPLYPEKIDWEGNTTAWSLNGTPTDCVKMAMSVLLKDNPPDLIVSGINKGSNAGRTVLYSGTVGGIIEGVHQNVPGIAFSSYDFHNPPYEEAEPFIFPIVKHFADHSISEGSFLNVNFPSREYLPYKGAKMAKQGKGYWMENPEERLHPEGRSYYWMGGKWSGFDEHELSDVSLLEKGYITAVPIHVNDITDHELFDKHEDLFGNLFKDDSSESE